VGVSKGVMMRSDSSRKNPLLVLLPLCGWSLLAFGVIWPFTYQFRMDIGLSVLARICGVIWWIVLLWTLHHLTFQVAVLFSRRTSRQSLSVVGAPPIAILYTTCDDFNPQCCESCIEQDYPNSRVLICDDSKLPRFRMMVEEFSAQHPEKCSVITRPDRRGFKAGNVNHAIENCVPENWILLVDADQILPPQFLSRLIAQIPADSAHVAFVQAAHEVLLYEPENSYFQRVMSAGVALYYQRNLAPREKYGFLPLLGHGVLINRSAWKAVGRFPEIVSEDFAFAMRAANHRFKGIYVRDISSHEAFPYDFGGFMMRFRKFAGGAAELFRQEIVPFAKGSASVIEKWDAFFQLIWYLLLPLIPINIFLCAYVSYRLWQAEQPYLHPVLPYVYSWVLFFVFTLEVSVMKGWKKVVQYYFWSTAVYAAAMPLTGLSFITHLFLRPTFQRTPKNGEETPLKVLESLVMIGIGLVAIGLVFKWPSPFSPVLGGYGVSFLSYPLYGKLCSDSLLGKLSRVLIYIPGMLMLLALYVMWITITPR
jgi:cellulose synthase/poly-beta-1,6-N-acetylglucosamine synthase-like glycosyltransferase